MSPERWQQVKQLFHAALERAPGERSEFLAQACVSDPELRMEVESLISAHHQPPVFIDRPAFEPSTTVHSGEHEEPLITQVMGPYKILRKLGKGGMGEVYLARDTRLGRSVALKVLRHDVTARPARVQRFQQEARAASALNHPNILTIHEVGQVDGRHFIATEFVDGKTLSALLAAGGRMSLDEALEVVLQVASALSAAHEAGIIHRDIKPENIMRRPDGYVKVLDFGLAKLIEWQTSSNETEPDDFETVQTDPGLVMGTINYMSPEQARGQDVDARTDIFSLGVVFFEIITGHLPFVGLTRFELLISLLEKDLLQLADYVPDAPAALQQIINRMLAKDLQQRYQTARELLGDLKCLKQELQLETPPDYSVSRSNSNDASGQRQNSDDQRAANTGSVRAHTTRRRAANVTAMLKRYRYGLAIAVAALILAVAGLALSWRLGRTNTGTIDSVAVLPFVNAAADPQMEYLPDGITESITRSLAQLPQLRVMARSTVFSYRGRQVDPRQVGKDLNVRAVVTGSVLERGEQLVIQAELVNASDGSLLWGYQYQRPLADIFAVQEDIAREISKKLRLGLSGEQSQQLAKRYTENVQAYRLYLLGRYNFHQFTEESGFKALSYFNQTIKLDPNYTLAYTGVADIYSNFSAQYLTPGEAMPKARGAALKALELDDTLAEAHYSNALVKWWADWDWQGAEREFKRAIELDPNLVIAHSSYADFLSRFERFDEALIEARRAQESDPLSAYASSVIGLILYRSRQYDRAIEQYHKTIELDPSFAWPYADLGSTLAQKGQYQEAIAEMQKGLALNRHVAILCRMAYLYALSGRRSEALEILTDLERQSKQRRVSPANLAMIDIGLGEKERALARLRQAYDEHSDHVLSLRVSPIFDSLRADPRFTKLVRDIGLVP